MATRKFRHGKGGRIVIGDGTGAAGVTIALEEWTVAFKADDAPTTNFESNALDANGRSHCFSEGLIGIEECDLTMKGSWDAGLNPMRDPPGLYPRDTGVSARLTIGRNDLPSASDWLFNGLRILTSNVKVGVHGVVTFDIVAKSDGVFTPPIVNS